MFRPDRILGIAFLVAILSRVVILILSHYATLLGDAWQYDHVAHQLIGGERPSPYWPPGLPYYLAAWKSLFGDAAWVSRWAMLPWWGGLMGLLWVWGRKWLDARWVAGGMVFLSLYPEWWMHSVEPLSHLPVATLLLGALTAQKANQTARSSIIAGLLIAAAVLFRPSVLLLALGFPLFLYFRSRRRHVLLHYLPLLLIVGATSFGLSQQHGRFVLLNDANARNFYLGNNAWTHWYRTWEQGSTWVGEPGMAEGFRAELKDLEAIPPVKRSKAYWGVASQQIAAAPLDFVVRTTSRIRTLAVFDTAYGARQIGTHGRKLWGMMALGLSALMFGLGMALVGKRWRFPHDSETPSLQRAVVGMAILYLLPYCFSFSHPTYHLAILPLGILLVARRGKSLAGKFHRHSWWIFLGILGLLQIEWILHMLGGMG